MTEWVFQAQLNYRSFGDKPLFFMEPMAKNPGLCVCVWGCQQRCGLVYSLLRGFWKGKKIHLETKLERKLEIYKLVIYIKHDEHK